MRCSSVVAGLLLIAIVSPVPAWSGDNGVTGRVELAAEARLRRPVAMAWSPDRSALLVANSRTGTISVLDVETLGVTREVPVGERLAAMVQVPGTNSYLLLDDVAHQLLVVRWIDWNLEVTSRQPVPHFPYRVAVDTGNGSCYVTSRWTRQLTRFHLRFDGSGDSSALTLQRDGDVVLPFPAGELLPLTDHGSVVVAHAFGGDIAVVDSDDMSVRHVHRLPDHNIRSIARTRNGEQLLMSCQRLNPLARGDFDDLDWGILLTNGVRVVDVDDLLDSGCDLAETSEIESMKIPSDAAGDPGPILIHPRGRMLICLSGVAEVAIGGEDFIAMDRHEVGERPVAAAVSQDGERFYVAGMLSDTVTVLDLSGPLWRRTIPLGPPAELTAADRGEVLFYDARLSHDLWMSCHSCHADGHTVDRIVDTLGDGDYGAPKRIPSLLGVARTGPWAWNGRKPRLEDQVRMSVARTLHGVPLDDEQVADLTTFLETLELPDLPPLEDDSESVARGREVFAQAGCAECHAGPDYTSADAYDVGLIDEQGRSRFNPPSLRGVSLRSAWLHDARATTLESIFVEHGHPRAGAVDQADLADLLAFLRSL
ncbi:Cytochrome c551 peroxidase precursor [Maioricimonas rarisocia]|uniref:Cytochrome c551 peroxidase n=1 Tax=Maioricimonas rarisocia TaxID=2528026 RepID=A0A517ZDM9_9PLAN|nr:cytochrome c peroxidase [Maioricimonas rarisocia]QDU40540.1 Cytochrome c551 peroxidase precursor [Maioricimonas rarisocia]